MFQTNNHQQNKYEQDSVAESLGAVSPRSKMLSLGVNSIKASPLRYRPQAPLDTKLLNELPASMYNPYNTYEKSKPFKTDSYHNNNNETMYQNPLLYSDNEEFTDFQKHILSTQGLKDNLPHEHSYYSSNHHVINNDTNNNNNNDDDDGLTFSEPLAYSQQRSNQDDKIKEKFREYQNQLKLDQTIPIEISRRKFVRKSDLDDYIPNGKFIIGKQIDEDIIRKQKLTNQIQYQEQLKSDQQSKSLDIGRKPITRRPISPESTHKNILLELGNNNNNNSYGGGNTNTNNESDRRRIAQMVLDSNRDDILLKLNERSMSPREHRKYKSEVSGTTPDSRSEEQMKFERANYKFIGNNIDTTKDKKKAMQEQYLTQLLNDNGPSKNISNKKIPDQYVNKYGWTGLNIGGTSGLEEKNESEKYLKQAAYKRLLDQQKFQKEELIRLNNEKYGKY